jgi:DNA invertase Pin-like site-specific DNA recombinase
MSHRATGYSYLRFSTAEQQEGDSLRRQTEGTAAWCAKNGVRLDAGLSLRDLGVSAFRGKHRDNPDKHALALFLKAVESGRVPRGSFLIVESLDRLTREHIRPALTLLLNLIEAGVRIVQLHPVEMTYDEAVEPMQLLMAIMELNRGHSESAMKSKRVGDAWAAKRDKARAGDMQPPRKRDSRVTRNLTAMLPAWVEEVDGGLRLIPGRAAVLKKIFTLAANGYGYQRIAARLNEEKIPAWGPSGQWTTSYIGVILRDRRAVGEYQPRNVHHKDMGAPIAAYYPPAVTEDEWGAAHEGAVHRGKMRGRVSEFTNLFTGLTRDARTGEGYFVTARNDEGGFRRVLVNFAATQGRAKCFAFPLQVFEDAILACLREIDPHEILNGDQGPDETQALAGELAHVEGRIQRLQAELRKGGDIEELASVVRDLAKDRQALADRLAEARHKASHPLSEVWGEARSIMATLKEAPDPQDARLRLRSKLRGIVESIYLLVVPRGRSRLAAVQLAFRRDSGQAGKVRHYLIYHVPPRGNGKARVEGRSEVLSFARVTKRADIDLRNPADVRLVEEALAKLEVGG